MSTDGYAGHGKRGTDLTGQVFGAWTALERTGADGDQSYWRCRRADGFEKTLGMRSLYQARRRAESAEKLEDK